MIGFLSMVGAYFIVAYITQNGGWGLDTFWGTLVVFFIVYMPIATIIWAILTLLTFTFG